MFFLSCRVTSNQRNTKRTVLKLQSLTKVQTLSSKIHRVRYPELITSPFNLATIIRSICIYN